MSLDGQCNNVAKYYLTACEVKFHNLAAGDAVIISLYWILFYDLGLLLSRESRVDYIALINTVHAKEFSDRKYSPVLLVHREK